MASSPSKKRFIIHFVAEDLKHYGFISMSLAGFTSCLNLFPGDFRMAEIISLADMLGLATSGPDCFYNSSVGLPVSDYYPFLEVYLDSAAVARKLVRSLLRGCWGVFFFTRLFFFARRSSGP